MKTASNDQLIPTREDVARHSAARNISDDDLCSNCAYLAYIPGDKSLCLKASHSYYQTGDTKWPGVAGNEGPIEMCLEHEIDTGEMSYEQVCDALDELFKLTQIEYERELTEAQSYRYGELWQKLDNDGIPIPFAVEI